MINDVADLKIKNVRSVLDSLRFTENQTKRDIAENTGLSVTTVAHICNELKQQNIITDAKGKGTRVGRIPSQITFQHQRFFVIGIDLQIAGLMGMAVTNLHNQAVFSDFYDISVYESVEAIADFAKAKFDAFAAEHSGDEELTVIGMGISVPAVYDAENARLVSSSVPLYEGVKMKAIFQERFELPVYVDNTSNFRVISAHTITKLDNIVCLDISQGVGVGIVCNGSLVRGVKGYGGELAHVPIGDMRLRCPSCGSYGCVEAELGLQHILQHYPVLREETPAGDPWAGFAGYLHQRREECEPLLKRIGFLVGALTSMLINLFFPSLFLITGYVADIYDLIQPYCMAEVDKRCTLRAPGTVDIQVEQYHSMSIYRGICDAIYAMWSPIAQEY